MLRRQEGAEGEGIARHPLVVYPKMMFLSLLRYVKVSNPFTFTVFFFSSSLVGTVMAHNMIQTASQKISVQAHRRKVTSLTRNQRTRKRRNERTAMVVRIAQIVAHLHPEERRDEGVAHGLTA